ncbi:hypothetical protein FHX53_000007 [Yonghaparkia alkaliphila]|uniref:Uncharacterized protein n=1 Tax=Microcella alkalica TaxID=355930 RepID=A0A839E5M4_9MICO|nr:hypothetical protein [Microcella alkalica]
MRWSTTSAVSAQVSAPRDSFNLGAAAAVVSCRHDLPQPEHR